MTNEKKYNDFRDLEIWKKCHEIRRKSWDLCKNFPNNEQYKLNDQIIRASRSTTANIAEGYGRFHYLDNAKFCSNSRGSIWEVLDHLITAHDEDLISSGLLEKGRKLVDKSVKLVNGYMNYLKRAGDGK